MHSFAIKRGDTSPALEGICRGGDGQPADLTGATVRVAIRRRGTAAVVLLANAEIVGDPTAGRVRYQWQPGETAALSGDYEYELEARRNDEVATFPGEGYATFRVWGDIVPEPAP